MKISLDWLGDYVELNLSPKALADALTMAGLEVEEIETKGEIPEGVIVAKILERAKHDNSDHLSICKVDTGNEVIQIVCGAPNCDAGNIVPLAMIGTVFKDGDGEFKIKKGKIRGVESFGMMCSARELELSGDHEGLMILPENYELGKPLSDYIEKDTVYTVEITPNRPDWLCHWGVARDIAALCETSLKFPAMTEFTANDSGEWNNLVTVEAQDLCPRYTARVIRGVKVAESPEWLKKRLNAVGIRPINNIVDITNFVMMELGQPLHTFDSRQLAGKRIVVRRAADGEKIVALDGKEYKLDNSNLVIADAEKPVAIAGVMGGEYSGIMDDTTEIVLESAYFDPASVRATSRKLGLSSDSSYRYERGTDPDTVYSGSERATQLILELAGGEVVSELVDVSCELPEQRKITAEFSKIRSLLGMDVSDKEIVHILAGLGFIPSNLTDTECTFCVPRWRMLDVAGRADLAEEVARIHGLDKLPVKPVAAPKADFKLDAYYPLEVLRNQLIATGLYETVNTSMIDEKSATLDGIFEAGDLIKPYNPISLDLAVMRPSLLPGMLNVVKHNIARRNDDLALFEMGRVFCKNQEKFPEERDELVIAITGRAHPERYSKERTIKMDFFDLKGIVESVLDARRISDYKFVKGEDKRFLKGVCAELVIDGKRAGFLGELVPHLTKGMRLGTPLYAAVIQIPALMNAEEKSVYYVPVSQFPCTVRDVAFIADSKLENATVIDFIKGAKLPNLESVELFDIFEDKSLGEGRKSMAYSLVFRSQERTLTDDEVNSSFEKIRAKLAKDLAVELR